MGSPDSDFLWDLRFQNFYEVFGLRFPTYEIPNKEERGRQQSEPFYGKASLLYWEAAVEAHSVDDTAARQQHGKAERCQGQKPSRPRFAGSKVYRLYRHQFCSCLFDRFYLPSATRCRVDCRRINAGVVSPGESLRLVAAGGLAAPKLCTNSPTTQCFNSYLLLKVSCIEISGFRFPWDLPASDFIWYPRLQTLSLEIYPDSHFP